MTQTAIKSLTPKSHHILSNKRQFQNRVPHTHHASPNIESNNNKNQFVFLKLINNHQVDFLHNLNYLI